MGYIGLNPLYYKHEGFGTLMGHYASMFSLALDTGLKPVIPYSRNYKFEHDSAMSFFNKFSDALDHYECFKNFTLIFNRLEQSSYNDIPWSFYNFQPASYKEIVSFIKENTNINYNCFWSLNPSMYWSHIDKIKNYLFEFDIRLIDYCYSKLPNTDKNLVAICVRNEYKKLSGPHTILSIDYYKEAMNLFDKNNTKFLIFSDIIDESIQMFSELEKIYDISYTEPMASAYGMCMMSLCKGIINANSSFSYWASILSKNCKQIICPTKFINEKLDHNLAQQINYKWYPSDWLGLETT